MSQARPDEKPEKATLLRDLMAAVHQYEGKIVGYNLSVLVQGEDGSVAPRHWACADRWQLLGLLQERIHGIMHDVDVAPIEEVGS